MGIPVCFYEWEEGESKDGTALEGVELLVERVGMESKVGTVGRGKLRLFC